MSNSSTDKFTKALFGVVVVLVLSVIAANFYTFFFQKNYDLLVETPCGEGEFCFIRHCGDGECPPNELERYRIFSLNASQFESCSGDSCEASCKSGAIQCKEVICEEEIGDVCTTFFATE